MYENIYFKLKSVQNVIGILLKTILKSRNSRFYENFYSRNCGVLPVLIIYSGVFGGNRNIGNTSKNIKCGSLMKKYGNLP